MTSKRKKPDGKPDGKPEIFTEKYWESPVPRNEGEKDSDVIFLAVGQALTKWETLDQSLANLFLVLTGTEMAPKPSREAVRRAYGTIFGNHGRRNAVRAAAEVYLERYWDHKSVRSAISELLKAIEMASKLRDNITHGVVHRIVGFGKPEINKAYGCFLVPPDYNTAFTYARVPKPVAHVLDHQRQRYRYVSKDINDVSEKFNLLRAVIDQYRTAQKAEPDGKISAIEDMLKDEAEVEKTK